MNKKERECLLLREVAGIFADFPEGAIVKSEQPDFLIQGLSCVTGVELVDYVRGQTEDGSPFRRNEIIWQEVADRARLEYTKQHAEPILVYFSWYPHRFLHHSDVAPLALEASKLISEHIPRNLFERVSLGHGEIKDTRLARYSHHISITRVRNQAQSLWSSLTAGFVSVAPSELQQIITRKDTRVSDYRTNCDSVWLLVIADGLRISSSADFSAVMDHVFETRFDNLLLYDRVDEVVNVLKVQSKD